MATKLHQAIRKTEGSTPKQPSKLSDQEPVCTKDKEIGTSQVIDSPETTFIAGNLKYCYPAWKKIFSDPVILNIINESINEGDFFSSLFFRPRKDGSFQTILN